MMERTLPSIPGGWACIVADPPWGFRDRGSRLAPDERRKRRRRRGYRTLAVEAIAALPVREVAAGDAFLFLWTTDAHLLDGSATYVARAWGFEPKRAWVWVKRGPPALDLRALLESAVQRLALTEAGRVSTVARAVRREMQRALRLTEGEDHGGRLAFAGGHYVRTAHELVLICRRGRAAFTRHDVRSVFFASRRGGGPRGEVHSTKPRELLALVETLCPGPRLELFAREARRGWSSWGDECPVAEGRAAA